MKLDAGSGGDAAAVEGIDNIIYKCAAGSHTHILNGPLLGVEFSGPGWGAAAVGGGVGAADAGGGGPRLLHDAEQVMV